MSSKIFRILCVLLAVALLSSGFTVVSPPDYKNITGVTREEIDAIDALCENRAYFSYGAVYSSEIFLDDNGDIDTGGFTPLFCSWLTNMFQIPFVPQIYAQNELSAELSANEIDFTGELTATDELKKTYYMTDDAVALRAVKYIRLANGEKIADIPSGRVRRFAVLEGAAIPDVTALHSFTSVKDYGEAYRLLKSGEIDALIAGEISEASFDIYGDVVSENFLPFVYTPVSLATQNPDLAPIISVVQKALKNETYSRQLLDMYNEGSRGYLSHKLFTQFTDAEKAYVAAHRGTYVKTGLEHDNYPVSFYNDREKEYQGIAVDVLDEISELTGLTFKPPYDDPKDWGEILKMLEDGEISLVEELLPTPAREGRFLWAENSYLTDYYALLSKSEYEDIKFNEIMYANVGLTEGTGYADSFLAWFPDHKKIKIYKTSYDAFKALERGEIDLFMGTRNLLLNETHYKEIVGYKANLVFDTTALSLFGFNKDEEILRGIVDKAIPMVDTEAISTRWKMKTFDYREKIAESRQPLLAGVSVLLILLLYRTFRDGRRLEKVVQKRTSELEQQTRLAQDASRAKSDFLSTMSHEIRTPMNAVIGMSELALRETSSPSVSGYIQEIKTAGMNLLSIINDILDFSKIESQKIQLLDEPYILASMINDVINLIRVHMTEKRIVFLVNVDPKIPNNLVGDQVRVRQILTNLLSNASKYTEEGFIKLTLTADMTNSDTLSFKAVVEDSGMGIRPEDVERLFSKFTRFDETKNKHIKGTGLGLSIAQALCKLMGGDIAVTSEYGKGSAFTAVFSQKYADTEKLAEVADAENKHILLYAGNALYGDSVSYTLKQLGTVTTRAYTEAEFFKLLDTGAYDFAFFPSGLAKEALKYKVKTSLAALLPFGESLIFDINCVVAPAFALPVANVLNGVIVSSRHTEQKIRFTAPSANVLVVDDIQTNLKVAEGLLAPYKMTVSTCLRAKEAIKLIREYDYDIVFMDHMMPEMDGMEATAAIRARGGDKNRKLVIIALTANAIMGVKEQFLQNGFNDYISKPIDPKNLYEAISKWIPVEKRVYAAEEEPPAQEETFEELPIEGVDSAYALKALGCSFKDYADLLRLYCRDIRERLLSLQSVPDEDELKTFTIQVHALKSASASVGATEVSEMAKALEQAGKNADFETISKDLGKFREKISTLEKNITDALPKKPENESGKMLDGETKGKLRACLTAKNVNGTNALLASLEEKQYGARTAEILSQIEDYVLMFEFAKAISALDELAKGG